MFAKAINFQGNIVIYYKNSGQSIRLATGVHKIPADEKYFRDGFVTNAVTDCELKNVLIHAKLEKVNSIITYYYERNHHRPPIGYIQSELTKLSQKEMASQKRYDNFQGPLLEMIAEKSQEPIVPESLKDYKSLYNSLRLYQHHNGQLTLDAMNSADFITSFERFLAKENDDKLLKKRFKTKGALNSNTIRKRVSSLKTFLKWAESKRLLQRDNQVVNYVSKVKKFQPTVVVLSAREQQELKKKVLTGDEEKLRDILLFLCATGMRYSDLLTLSKDDVQGDFIVKDADKSRERFKVPLNTFSKSMIKKYNCNFSFFSTVMFNRLIVKADPVDQLRPI